MKILHLFSNWKWTGPAEPAVNLCKSLSERHEVVFICGAPPERSINNDLLEMSRARGLEPRTGFRLSKHIHFLHNFSDGIKLRRTLRKEKYDLVHVHLPNDHLLAGVASLGMRKKPLIVRSFYGADGPESNVRTNLLLQRFTHGAIVISQWARNKLCKEYRFSTERIARIPVGVDTQRFCPQDVDRNQAKQSFSLDPDDFVLGIVARMQRHRKFKVLLEAMKKAMAEEPRLKLLIVGRGTHQEEVAIQPVKDMGLSSRVCFAGYLQGEQYVKALAAMDGAVFLVPGSDGSCRAVREKMAMGLPVIAANIPPLDEMIEPGKTGFLVDLDAKAIRDAALTLLRNPEDSRRMGREARSQACGRFSLEKQGEEVERFYQHLLGLGSSLGKVQE